MTGGWSGTATPVSACLSTGDFMPSRRTEQIPKEDYMKYFEEFNPVDFEPRKWAKAAKEAGMKYMVLTAKHHDGFCLFDSQYTDFKSTNTKCGRDLVAEYVDAVRAEGLKVGLYFSLLDWFHDDFPHYGDRNHPMRNNPRFRPLPDLHAQSGTRDLHKLRKARCAVV